MLPKIRTQSLALLACCLHVNTACSCPASPALETFLCNANEELLTRKLLGEVFILLGDLPPGSGVGEEKQRIKPFLAKARNSVFFNSKAGDFLNDFYGYWVTVLEDMSPYSYEGLSAYQHRADERYFALQERANRLRISLE